MFDWITSDPETMWLNVTNIVLGLCVLVCVAVGAVAIGRDVLAQVRQRVSRREVLVYDSHAMFVPELGMTMADGGEPVHEDKPKPDKD